MDDIAVEHPKGWSKHAHLAGASKKQDSIIQVRCSDAVGFSSKLRVPRISLHRVDDISWIMDFLRRLNFHNIAEPAHTLWPDSKPYSSS